jgi:hypothetical protein
MIFHTANTEAGLLEYRETPLYRAFRVVKTWLWLPAFIIRPAQRHAIQRRINGGPWQYIGG